MKLIKKVVQGVSEILDIAVGIIGARIVAGAAAGLIASVAVWSYRVTTHWAIVFFAGLVAFLAKSIK